MNNGWRMMAAAGLLTTGACGPWTGNVAPGAAAFNATVTPVTVSGEGYPAPPSTATPPQGYVPPPTLPPVTSLPFPTETTPTPHALALTATVAPKDGTVYDLANRFSIELLPGWFAQTASAHGATLPGRGFTTIANYNFLEAFEGVPPDHVSLRIIVQSPDRDQPIEVWLSEQRQQQTSPEFGVPPGTTLTEPQPIRVGRYEGLSYLQMPPTGDVWRLLYLFVDSRSVVVAAIVPVDTAQGSLAEVDAMAVLATINVVP
jgi:hypothetical protein